MRDLVFLVTLITVAVLVFIMLPIVGRLVDWLWEFIDGTS